MKSLTSFVWRGKTVIIPLIGIILATIILFDLGYKDAAWFVSYLGTPFILVLNCLYIVFFHSRTRWPNDSWHARMIKVLTFQR